jgi:pimeloyl-ACP methyl ester carboxylesterase
MAQNGWISGVVSGVSLVVRTVGLGLLVYALLMFAVQRRLAFPGVRRDSPRPTATAPAGARQVWLETSFGRVEAWFRPVAGAASTAPSVLFAHGNGELIEDWQAPMESLRNQGVNALLVEFPGYGHSEGSPSRESIRETFNEAFDWLVREGGVDVDRIVAYGRSLGGGAAADLSLDRPVRALALQSTFSSAVEVAREMFLPGFMVRDRFDNRRAVAAFGGPVLLMHGPQDEVISYEHAERLASVRPGLRVTQIACGHNDCGPVWPSIVASLTGFLRDHGLMSSGGPPPRV